MLHLSQIPVHIMLINFPQHANTVRMVTHSLFFHSSQEFLGYYQFSILKWENSGPSHLKGISKVTLVKRRKASVQPFLTASGPVQLFHNAKPPRQDTGAEGSWTARMHMCVCSSRHSSQSHLWTPQVWPFLTTDHPFKGWPLLLGCSPRAHCFTTAPTTLLPHLWVALKDSGEGNPPRPWAELWAMTIPFTEEEK